MHRRFNRQSRAAGLPANLREAERFASSADARMIGGVKGHARMIGGVTPPAGDE
ncbi:MAG TPA: hypothetical protein VGA37_00765 [Gemmatimonadales bacterium]